MNIHFHNGELTVDDVVYVPRNEENTVTYNGVTYVPKHLVPLTIAPLPKRIKDGDDDWWTQEATVNNPDRYHLNQSTVKTRAEIMHAYCIKEEEF